MTDDRKNRSWFIHSRRPYICKTMTESSLQQLARTAAYIKSSYSTEPSVGIVLGSGIGGLISEIDVEYRVAYADIPDFPVSTVKGHSGELIFGKMAGKTVVAMAGRFHYY